MSPEPLLLVERDEPIAVVLLNRPKQLNALSDGLMEELVGTLTELDADPAIRCIVLGDPSARSLPVPTSRSSRARRRSSSTTRRIERWDAIRALWTPLVAAVSVSPRRRLRAGDDV